MKLELKHLAPYLPYGLKCLITSPLHKSIDTLETISFLPDQLICLQEMGDWYFNSEFNEFNCKPILRPLSEIYDVEEIMDQFSEYSLERFEISFFTDLGRCGNCFDFVNYTQMVLFFKNHFDVFNLIPNDLAIDINTINS